MADYGVRVSERFQASPLYRLKPRTLRLWMVLAMKAQHKTQTMWLDDGQRVMVAPGQWLTSTRKLRKELGGSLQAVTAGLNELLRAGVITLRAIPRIRNGNTPVSKTDTTRTENGNAQCVMATLVTVEGLSVAAHPVSEMETNEEIQREIAASPRLSLRERQERISAEHLLAAEGR